MHLKRPVMPPWIFKIPLMSQWENVLFPARGFLFQLPGEKRGGIGSFSCPPPLNCDTLKGTERNFFSQNKVLKALDPVMKVRDSLLGGGDENTISEKHDSNVEGNEYVAGNFGTFGGVVDRHGDAGSPALNGVKKQDGGGGSNPMALAGYAVAGIAGMVLLSSAMTVGRFGGQGTKVISRTLKHLESKILLVCSRNFVQG